MGPLSPETPIATNDGATRACSEKQRQTGWKAFLRHPELGPGGENRQAHRKPEKVFTVAQLVEPAPNVFRYLESIEADSTSFLYKSPNIGQNPLTIGRALSSMSLASWSLLLLLQGM